MNINLKNVAITSSLFLVATLFVSFSALFLNISPNYYKADVSGSAPMCTTCSTGEYMTDSNGNPGCCQGDVCKDSSGAQTCVTAGTPCSIVSGSGCESDSDCGPSLYRNSYL